MVTFWCGIEKGSVTGCSTYSTVIMSVVQAQSSCLPTCRSVQSSVQGRCSRFCDVTSSWCRRLREYNLSASETVARRSQAHSQAPFYPSIHSFTFALSSTASHPLSLDSPSRGYHNPVGKTEHYNRPEAHQTGK